MGSDYGTAELVAVSTERVDEAPVPPQTREDLARAGIVGVNPDLAERLLRFGYASSAA
ncbi:hypothetical protein [Calidifontibacter indicus]|uniref:Uncharacterized protein n=1 Tax=Calidifontibacter indicus TaxID=419650 RepID=A0A3D9UFB6_9MICO|nr:hypothetical protein [Calidifontibacter indicus]REF24644.1 hypothetical protein DFJ65_3430 [Calidifontibacter indicus]